MGEKRSSAGKWLLLISVLALFAIVGGTLFWRSRHIDQFTREWVVRSLSERFATDVELEALHVTAYPEMTVQGRGLTIHHRERKDIPFIHIDAFTFHLGTIGIFRVPHEIRAVGVQNMSITIPPREEKPPAAATKNASSPLARSATSLPAIVVDEIVCDNTALIIMPKKAGKEPLEWDIHALNLYHAGADQAMEFHGTLTNAKPQGEIATKGSFGPWNLDEKGATPVSGTYEFTNADLGPFPGIAGILSSTGKYGGQLDELEVSGVTDTPDFSLDRVGKPVPLHTEYSATVDGLTGDTYLHPVRATLLKSVIVSQGSVVKVPGRGHNISLDIQAPDARIQDILALAVKDETPLLAGPAKIKAKLFLPPGKIKVIQKMTLDADVTVDNAHWNSPKIREELESLSRHAEGKPEDETAGSSVSDLKCKFHLEKGVVHFSSVTFSVPGASILLAGDYGIQGGELDFKGRIRLQAKLSQLVTGAKSGFLKVLDPFFSKNGAGTELPVTITGTRDDPMFGVSVFHKTFHPGDKNKNPSDNGTNPLN
jgi:AsmA-like C-terminal region